MLSFDEIKKQLSDFASKDDIDGAVLENASLNGDIVVPLTVANYEHALLLDVIYPEELESAAKRVDCLFRAKQVMDKKHIESAKIDIGVICDYETYISLFEFVDIEKMPLLNLLNFDNLEKDLAYVFKEGEDILESEEEDSKSYMILDLTDYSISYSDEEPEGGWSNAYKTVKMALSYIPAGGFVMGSPDYELVRENDEILHEVILTKPFYMGVFPVTWYQYYMMTGHSFAYDPEYTRPMNSVSYEMLRGRDKGALWPLSDEVDDCSFFGKLRARTGLKFDLPTEAQWEYACRAGTMTPWNDGAYFKYNFKELGRSGVGTYLPNNWGLFDMHGGVWEWCLDWYGPYESGLVHDPKGAKSSAKGRVVRGGCYKSASNEYRSAQRCSRGPNVVDGLEGFRVILTKD